MTLTPEVSSFLSEATFTEEILSTNKSDNSSDKLLKSKKELVKSSVITSLDVEFRERIWNGKIGILFSLSPNENISKKEPNKVLLLMSRMSYLTIFVDKIRKHFLPHAPAIEDGLWFECKINKTPLRWNYPIGVLYDLYGNNTLPWKIIVHFQSYPNENVISRCDTMDIVKSFFLNSLKQSIYLSYGNISMISKLTKNDEDNLFNSVIKNRFDLWLIVNKIMFDKNKNNNNNSNNSNKSVNDNLKLLRYPFRIILNGFNNQIDLCPIQRLINVNNNLTLDKLFSTVIPGIYQKYILNKNSKEVKVIIHGMNNISLDTPLLWLVKKCCHADYFLYIIIVKK